MILLLGIQGSWAQKPPKDTLVPPSTNPQAQLPTALLPPPDVTPPAPAAGETAAAGTTPPTVPPKSVSPGPEVPVPDVPTEGDSNFIAAEVETLKPTNRDPFAKPKSLLEKEIESTKTVIDPSVYIDMRIEPIRRFPLRNYLLVGIISDVENPKAMVKDPDNNMHLLTTNQRIGNQEGLIVKIERGELVVEEKGKIVTLKLHK